MVIHELIVHCCERGCVALGCVSEGCKCGTIKAPTFREPKVTSQMFPHCGGNVCEVTKAIRKLGLFSVPQSRAGFVRSGLKGPAPRRAASSKARDSLCACLGDNSLQHLFETRNGAIWGGRLGGAETIYKTRFLEGDICTPIPY